LSSLRASSKGQALEVIAASRKLVISVSHIKITARSDSNRRLPIARGPGRQ
jgi:hypothetical protein